MVRVRYAREDDMEAIAGLEQEWMKEGITCDTYPYSTSELQKAIKDKRLLVAEEDRIVGFLLFKFSDDYCDLDTIYVAKNHRGKKLGDKLMEKFLSLDKVKKYNKIYLSVDSVYEDRLVKFYSKFGFKRVAVQMLKQK